MNPAPAAIQTSRPLRTRVTIMADSSAPLPTKIELIKAGVWPATSVKGPLTITETDLHEFKRNFDAGVGIPSGLGKLPIDFSHEDWKQAAGWITALEVAADAKGTPTLFAFTEWSKSGAEALQGGEYKLISPSFWPACLGEWYDPEDADITARNVLVGAGLTNIPFFKDLTPIMASSTSQTDAKVKNVIYINADERIDMPTLDEVRILDADKLTEEQKKVLVDNQTELSTEERDKFKTVLADTAGAEGESGEGEGAQNQEGEGEGAGTDKNNEGEAMTQETKEAVALQADVTSGKKVVMDASEVQAMRTQIDAHAAQLAEYKEKEVRASVLAHVKRGAIKADQADAWTKRIVADATSAELIDNLPDNQILASEIGASSAADVSSAAALFDQKVEAAVKASNGTLDYAAAVNQVAASEPQLVNDRQKELTTK